VSAPQSRIYWVFGRKSRSEPYEQVGSVKATSDAIAYLYARTNYRERPWQDLCVVPREAFYAPALGE